MIASLRAFFLARAFREKVLLAGWFVLVAAVWASSLSGRVARFTHRVHQTTNSLNEQQLWLGNRAAIEAQAQAAAGKLEAARTLDAPRLLAEVLAIADEAGLKTKSSSEAKDSALGQFSVHTIQFSVTKVDWGTLKEFYLALGKRSPYIGIEEYTMQVDRANPTLLTANFQLSSVEIARN